jgi:hypothetical protein
MAPRPMQKPAAQGPSKSPTARTMDESVQGRMIRVARAGHTAWVRRRVGRAGTASQDLLRAAPRRRIQFAVVTVA